MFVRWQRLIYNLSLKWYLWKVNKLQREDPSNDERKGRVFRRTNEWILHDLLIVATHGRWKYLKKQQRGSRDEKLYRRNGASFIQRAPILKQRPRSSCLGELSARVLRVSTVFFPPFLFSFNDSSIIPRKI